MPNADEVTVREVLDLFDGHFASVAGGVAKGEFAFWIGSGISRKAPNLGGLIELGIESLRVRAMDPATTATFFQKFEQALKMGEGALDELRPYYHQPFKSWPKSDAIRTKLWNKYSRFLDIRIAGQPADYMLWEAIDIRQAFANPVQPAAEHICLAILILEGAVHEVASANWDGFIEAAVSELSGGADGLLQVVVDPNHLRSGAGIARLIKFHGCIRHATDEPDIFRPFLTGSHTQITEWPDQPKFAAVVAAVTGLATNLHSLVMGLSIQDANLQGVFSKAKKANPWPWPPDPDAPGHVFCEDKIKEGQQDVLKIVYGAHYTDHMEAIEAASHLRSWAEQVLIALVLNVLSRKLASLMSDRLHGLGCGVPTNDVVSFLHDLRNFIAELAVTDAADESRTPYVKQAISVWSRVLAVFRTGGLPTITGRYEKVSASGPKQLLADANAVATRLGDFGIAMSLLYHGQAGGHWRLEARSNEPLEAGALAAQGTWDGAPLRPIFVVKGAGEAVGLDKAGALADNNAIVIHSDSTWSDMTEGSGSPRRVRKAPGRTGRLPAPTRHVSLQKILERGEDANGLMKELVSELSL
ncbi:hypothetical protein GFL93_38250 [Rhizobium leguminosarum bv. viciae]|uniref:hypothetical protein n=1 Tax=Rhizobium TaxID=379 RepID=UPI0014428789|nr:hypothetical protein [Rhizobium leguminosarum]NKK11582.1 hypothetical protein [Rhizobium leguminosarum bv. viciae]